MPLDLPRLSLVLVATALVAACGGNAPTPASVSTGEMKGKYGVFYYVNVSRPVGGTINSGDGKIDCGTVVGVHDLCGPALYNWTEKASLTATPDTTDLYFQSWAGDCSGAIPDGCILDTDTFGADKWVAAVFNPADRLGHTSIPNPGQHGPLFLDFIKKTAGTPRCNTCHGVNFGGLANAPSCTACHAQSGHGNWLTDCSFCHGNPPLPSHAARSPVCSSCHTETILPDGTINAAGGTHMNGTVEGGACGSCHALPPSNGAHLAHWRLDNPLLASAYDDVGTLEDRLALGASAGDGYAFGCANCHPLDPEKHMDGIVQMELFDPAAPAGSIKALNPSTATYVAGPTPLQGEAASFTGGTCSNVYCHSRMEFTAPDVPEATLGTGPDGYPLVYGNYTVTAQRIYSARTWDGQAPAGQKCAGCHEFPPQSAYPESNAGAGDSHSWVDMYGYGNLHGFGMGFGPIACATCHFDTVIEQGVRRFSSDGRGLPVYEDVPIASFAAHVNGRSDVRFTDDSVSVGDIAFSSSPGDPAPQWIGVTKTCTNVSCHMRQTEAKWGAPYRWYGDGSYECNSCHTY